MSEVELLDPKFEPKDLMQRIIGVIKSGPKNGMTLGQISSKLGGEESIFDVAYVVWSDLRDTDLVELPSHKFKLRGS